MEAQQFDPARHLSLVSGKEYLEVKWRLVWLRTNHPDATIHTTLISHANSMAVVQAHVIVPGGGEAMGLGMEDAQGFGDYLEKAETKAIGRALGALGFGTQFCSDFEFGAAAGRVVDSPVANGSAPAPMRQDAPRQQQQQTRANGASEKQYGLIDRMVRDDNVSADDLANMIVTASNGYSTYETLTSRDASSLIDLLKGGDKPAPTQNQGSGYANTPRPAAGNTGDAMTPAQSSLISRLWLEKGASPDEGSKHAYVLEAYGIAWEDMTKRDASTMIEAIKQDDWTPIA